MNPTDITIRVGSINVRGLGSKRKQYQLSRLFMETDLDIIAVQETKVESEEGTDRMVDAFRPRYYVCVSHSVGKAGGCALFIRSALNVVIENVVCDVNGRQIVCDFVNGAVKWRAICVYAPNKVCERKVFFEGLKSQFNCQSNILLMGDFNCVCYAEDRVLSPTVHDASAQFLATSISEGNLVDVGYVMGYGATPKFTHFQGASHARLDRIYMTADLITICSSYEVKSVCFSDHCLVMLALGPRKPKFNWALWKLNSKLLNDEPFVKKVNHNIQNLLERDCKSIAEAWECFKQETKLMAMERSCTLRREEKRKEKELQCQLDFYLTMESSCPGIFAKGIKEVKVQLESVDQEKYRGAVIRARAERLWCGENPTKRALSDEKSYASRNEIRAITYRNEIVRENEYIQRAFHEHYSELLGSERELAEGFENHFLKLLPKLDDDVRLNLEQPITVAEIEHAINELAVDKSPGPDGLGAAFYKAFKKDMAIILHELINEAYEKQVLPPSFHESHVVLIPKSDDPQTLLSVRAYRPISLTNTDYKIYTKVLGRRLQSVIQKLVGPHQTCGIKGRSIMTNIHVARTVLECCDAFSEKVAILQLDLEKAFDRVAHEILFLVLEHVNVGSVLTEGVKMCYDRIFSKIIINKTLTESIQLKSSVRQGCCLSPLLFALYLEPFCLKVLSCSDIVGYRVGSSEIKLLAYADDVAVFCSDKDSVTKAVDVARNFCKMSGSVINWGKSVGLLHGAWEDIPTEIESIHWTSSPMRYLGVPLQHFRDTKDYWKEQCAEVKEKTKKFGGRDLSMFTRATVCNLFLVAKIWFVLQALCASRTSIQKIHREFAVFIWGSVWERTSRTNLFTSVKRGGLGLAHLFLRQVVSRFLFLRDQKNVFLLTVFQERLSDVLPNYIVSTQLARTNIIRGFLREVVWAYQFLCARFSLEYLSSVKRKKLYKDVVEICLPLPIYRTKFCIESGANVLKRVKRMPVRSSAKSFFFQLHSETLPVKPWLEEKGLFVAWSVNCLRCRKPETIEHIFLDCSDAVFLWDVLKRTLKKELPVTPYGIRFLPTSNDNGVPHDMFMLLCLHSLWKTRMAVRHEHIRIQSARENFIESMLLMREVYKARNEDNEWISVLDELASIKCF